MKKIIATLALIIVCQGIFAQNIDTLFSHYKDKEGADYMNIPSLMLKFMRTFTKSNNDKSYHFIKGIKSVKVLDMEDCTPEVRTNFLQEAKKLKLSGYETLVQTKEDGEEVTLLTKMDPFSEERIFRLTYRITPFIQQIGKYRPKHKGNQHKKNRHNILRCKKDSVAQKHGNTSEHHTEKLFCPADCIVCLGYRQHKIIVILRVIIARQIHGSGLLVQHFFQVFLCNRQIF